MISVQAFFSTTHLLASTIEDAKRNRGEVTPTQVFVLKILNFGRQSFNGLLDAFHNFVKSHRRCNPHGIYNAVLVHKRYILPAQEMRRKRDEDMFTHPGSDGM